MSASDYAFAEVEDIVEDVVGEEYKEFDEIVDGVKLRKGGLVAPSSVEDSLNSEEYDVKIEGLEEEEPLEVLYKKSD